MAQAVDTKADRKPRSRSNLRYLAERLGFYAVTAAVAVTANFMIPRFMPGDPAQALALQIRQQTGTELTPEMIEAIKRLYGDPDQNLLGQYWEYLTGLAHLEFGISVSKYPTPVIDLIALSLPWTLFLVGISTILAWLIGTALGAIVGWKPGGLVDTVLTPLSTFFASLPSFWVSILFLFVFGFRLRIFPLSGGYDPNVPYDINNLWFLLSVLKYGALPMMTMVFVGFAGWLFGMRNMMVTTVTEDYVTLARAKGLSERRILFRYAARNALLPNATGLAMAMGGVIGGVVLSEIVFTYPGMGNLLYQSIVTKDFPVMQTIFLMIVLAVLVANFIADSIYVLLDPRIKEG